MFSKFKQLIVDFIIKNITVSYLSSFFYFLFYRKKNILRSNIKRKILIVQTIFVKNEYFLDLNMKSIMSIGEYIKTYKSNVEIIFGFAGRTYNDESRDKIESQIKEKIGSDVKIVRYKKNLGKATYLNNLVSDMLDSYSHISDIVTLDSDIIFSLDCPFMFDRISGAINFIENKKKQKYGILGLDLVGINNHHITTVSQKRLFFESSVNGISYGEGIYYGYLCLGIAGACRVINREFWEDVGGYKYIGAYGPDDAILLSQCVKRGYSWQVLGSVFVVHSNQILDKTYVKEKVDKNFDYKNKK